MIFQQKPMDAKGIDRYKELYSQYSMDHQKIRKQLNILAILRLLTFVAGVWWGYRLTALHLWSGVVFAAAMLALFIYLIILFIRKKRRQSLLVNLIRVNANEIEALRGHVGSFGSGVEFQDHAHHFATDLELFGDRSLFQHINRTSTYAGKNQLASWLTNLLKRESDIVTRQRGIHELKGMLTWRQHFTATGYHLQLGHYRDTQLIAWSKEAAGISSHPLLRIGRWVLPLLTLTGTGFFIAGLLPVGYLLVMLAVNLVVLRRVSGKISTQHHRVTKQIPTLKNYSLLFRHIEKQDFKAQALQDLRSRFFNNHHPASRLIKRLSHISDALDNRYNMIAGIFLNLFFLWDIHQVARLEHWHSRYAGHIEDWLSALGSMDAFLSLANFSYNNKDFNFPHISHTTLFEARDIGHPLIPQHKRITNNLSIDRQRSTIIVTGANMAGKSTFLRTIGVNLILAMAGSPVCAREMSFRITHLFTSMNITDSLTRNESYFYAEIKRLKQLTDQALQHENMLVLLDEILTGTNTRDKEKASRAFVQRLLKMNLTSIIATHDLSLTSLEEDHPNAIRNTSFEVELENGHMKYDYKLREGVAQNMNALALLRDMGLI